MLDAIVLSDLHLGSSNCQAKLLVHLLERVETGELRTRRIVLNGDVFDSIDFCRLTKHHWKVLSLIRKLSDAVEIVWVLGNHDGSAEIVSHMLGTAVEDEYTLTSGGRRMLFLHGHQYDEFIDAHPILTMIGDWIYWLLQKVDSTHYFAKLAKKGSKTFLRCAQKVEDGAVAYARKRDCQVVSCGHTHHAVESTRGEVHYFNSGCWTELPCTYLAIEGGRVELRYVGPAIPEPVVHEEPAAALVATPS